MPVFASAAAVSRAAPSAQGESALGGDSALLGVAVFAALVGAFYFIATSDDNDEPASP